MNKIGKLLKAYRLEHDLSLDEVAFMLDIAVEEYSAMESELAEIGLKHLLKLCRYYDIKPDAFLKPEETESNKVPKSEPLADRKEDKVEEPIIDETDEDDEADYPSIYELDRSKRKVTAKQAVGILKKHGTEVTEEEAEKVLDFMYKMAPIALSQATREARWQQKLQRYPKGFAIKGKKYSCRLCGHGSEEDQRWYDRFGLKCMACQNAVDRGIVPGELTGNDTLYYSEHDLGHYFRLEGKVLREWIKKGLLKPRIIPRTDGKGKHYQVFLTSDHKGFLPPITMFRIGVLVEEEEDSKKYIRGTQWYEHVDPFEYLKDYGIMAYMKYKDIPQKEDDKNEEPKSE